MQAQVEVDYKVTVLIDGLSRSQERQAAHFLRRRGVPVKKVRGVKKDENDALIRLADAVCGFVRDALEKQKDMKPLFDEGLRLGWLIGLRA